MNTLSSGRILHRVAGWAKVISSLQLEFESGCSRCATIDAMTLDNLRFASVRTGPLESRRLASANTGSIWESDRYEEIGNPLESLWKEGSWSPTEDDRALRGNPDPRKVPMLGL